MEVKEEESGQARSERRIKELSSENTDRVYFWNFVLIALLISSSTIPKIKLKQDSFDIVMDIYF